MHVLLPAFQKSRREGAAIGRMLAGYGELEYDLCLCLVGVLNDHAAAVQALFSTRGEKRRIKDADARIRPAYVAAGLESAYDQAFDAMDYCRLV